MLTRIVFVCCDAAMLVVFGGGQEGSPSPVSSQPESNPADEALEVTVTPETAEVLAKADGLEGQSDKVVSLCASCALGMDGSEEHSLRVGEYTMYFCADDCKQEFSKDISESILGMQLPTQIRATTCKSGSAGFGDGSKV